MYNGNSLIFPAAVIGHGYDPTLSHPIEHTSNLERLNRTRLVFTEMKEEASLPLRTLYEAIGMLRKNGKLTFVMKHDQFLPLFFMWSGLG